MGDLSGSPLLFFDPTLQIVRSGDSFYTRFESVGRELKALSSRLDSLIICGQVRDVSTSIPSYKLPDEVSVVALPYWAESGDKSGFLRGIHLNAPRVYRTLQQIDVDIVLIRSGPHPASIIAWLACKNKDMTILYFIGSDFKQNTYIRTENSSFFSKLLERTLATVVDSMTKSISKSADATLVHPGHLESKYDGANRLYTTIISTVFAEEVRETTDTSSESPLSILYVGGLSRPKGVDILIRSFAALQSTSNKELNLTIRGTGGDESQLRRLAAEEGVANQIEFVPYLEYDELLELYRYADIFVLPSRQEGQGRVLIEALASGCAVVATDVGGIPHIVQHQKNGLLVEPNNETALTRSLAQLVKNDDLRTKFAQAGISWAQKNTLEIQTEDLLKKIQIVHE